MFQPWGQTEDLCYLDDTGVHRGIGGKPREQAPTLPPPRNHRRCDRLLHGQLGEYLYELERACEAAVGKPDRADTGDRLAHEQNFARARLEQSREQVDERRLASTVGANNRDELILVHRHADILERPQDAEGLAKFARLQQRTHEAVRVRLRASSPASPAMPSGNPMTISARMAPSTKRQYSVSDCSWSCSKVKVSAPIIGPKKLEKPPSTAINTSWPDCVQSTSSGSARPTRKPRMAPPAAPSADEMTKAARRKWYTCTPRYSALRGLSRSARRCRPNGESTIRHMPRPAKTSRPRQ